MQIMSKDLQNILMNLSEGIVLYHPHKQHIVLQNQEFMHLFPSADGCILGERLLTPYNQMEQFGRESQEEMKQEEDMLTIREAVGKND